MVKVHMALPYNKRLLPFLLEPLGPPDELWMMGQAGDCATVHPQLASALLKNVKETSSITVPEAPVIALKELAQLLHLGRYIICQHEASKAFLKPLSRIPTYNTIHEVGVGLSFSQIFRTSRNITRDIMEWVLYIFKNLHGDSSCLALTSSSIASLPLSKSPPGDDIDPSAQLGPGHLPNPRPHVEVLFDGNLNDILGGTLGDAIEQGKVLEPEDRVEIDLEINNRDQEQQDKAPDMVIYPNFLGNI